MNSASWTKQPYMKRRLPFDASQSLLAGDSLTDTYEAKIFDSQGQDLSATMLAGVTRTGNIIYVWVQGGSTGTSYYLRVRVTTTLGELLEDDLAINVLERHK